MVQVNRCLQILGPLPRHTHHVIAGHHDAGRLGDLEDLDQPVVLDRALHDLAPDPLGPAFHAIDDVATPGLGDGVDQLGLHRLGTCVDGETHPDALRKNPAELVDPGVVDGERIIQKDDIRQLIVALDLLQLGHHAVQRPAPAIGPDPVIQLIVHPRRAIRARERTAALRGHVHNAPALVQHVARHERHGVDLGHRRAQARMAPALDPDVLDFCVTQKAAVGHML